MFYRFDIAGVVAPKPRMTQRDKFAPSAAVSRYWQWVRSTQLQILQQSAGQVEPLIGPLALEAVFRLRMPKRFTRKQRAEALAGRLLPAKKPDLKNLLASLEDALNGVLWSDDGQFCRFAPLVKVYGEEPGVEFQVSEIEEY